MINSLLLFKNQVYFDAAIRGKSCEKIGPKEVVGRISFRYCFGQSIDLAFVKDCGIESSSSAYKKTIQGGFNYGNVSFWP
jgi:hypothetical protein